MERLRNPHPGDTLGEVLEERGLTAYKLAQATGLPETALSQIVRGKRRITPRTALCLAEFFETSAEFWLHMQTAYDLEEERRRQNAFPKAQAALEEAKAQGSVPWEQVKADLGL